MNANKPIRRVYNRPTPPSHNIPLDCNYNNNDRMLDRFINHVGTINTNNIEDTDQQHLHNKKRLNTRISTTSKQSESKSGFQWFQQPKTKKQKRNETKNQLLSKTEEKYTDDNGQRQHQENKIHMKKRKGLLVSSFSKKKNNVCFVVLISNFEMCQSCCSFF